MEIIEQTLISQNNIQDELMDTNVCTPPGSSDNLVENSPLADHPVMRARMSQDVQSGQIRCQTRGKRSKFKRESNMGPF